MPLRPTRLQQLMGAEERLLLLTAGDPANDPAIREASRSSIDWTRFVGLAQLERAVPIVYPRLRRVAGDLVEPRALEKMRRLASVSDFAMLHLETRLRESLQTLESRGVRVLLLKGAALAHGVYAGAHQRPMSDIDVLVDPANATTVAHLMLEAGWRGLSAGFPDEVYDRHHHLPPLHDSKAPDLQLEVHTSLFPARQPFALDVGDLWEQARTLGPAMPNVLVPSAMHLLLHACLHFAWSHQGRFGVWRTIRDVDALTRTDAIDWNAFVRVARSARGGTSCYWTLRIAELTAGVTVPKEVTEQLRPPRREYVLQAIERHFVRNLFPVAYACPSVTLDRTLWELALMPEWSGHGDIRPWDDDGKFFSAAHAGSRLHRKPLRQFLAASAYLQTLL